MAGSGSEAVGPLRTALIAQYSCLLYNSIPRPLLQHPALLLMLREVLITVDVGPAYCMAPVIRCSHRGHGCIAGSAHQLAGAAEEAAKSCMLE